MLKLFEFVEHIGKWRVLIQTHDIQNGAVTTAKIADYAVTTDKIGDGEVKSRNIEDDAVTTDKIGDGEVKSRNIGEGAVTTDKIGDDEVHTNNIANGAVTTEKILDDVIIERHIADEAVTTEKIAPHAVTREKIADEAIPELLGLMDQFAAAVREEIRQQQPVTINGNVVNAADEEDLTVVEGLLKLKDRSGLYGYGMKILRRGEPFAASVTQTRCIYVVQYDFDLGGERVTMPAESLLLFTGGRLSHGVLAGTKDTGGAPSGEAAFGLILCSALYYDYLDDVELEGDWRDETVKSLQSQIDLINGGNASVSVTVKQGSSNVSNVFSNTDYALTIAAAASLRASVISIKKNGTEIQRATDATVAQVSEAVNLSGGSSVTYRADAQINGVAKSASKVVTAFDKVFWGMGTVNDWSTAVTDSKLRTSVADAYDFTYAQQTPYVYILVPTTMADLTKAEMGAGGMGDYNLLKITDSGEIAANPGVSYRVWRGVRPITQDIQLIIK